MKSEDKVYVQCQSCGDISILHINSSDEEVYVKEYKCPCCGHVVGLNLGSKKEDIYMYINSNVDYRYYEY